MTVTSSLNQATAMWRQAIVDAKRAAVEVARLQARDLKAQYQRPQRPRGQKIAYQWHLGDPAAITGRTLDESG